MAEIAVVHPDLGLRGGAEDVCMHAMEALQGEHELTLFTLRRPDVPDLNDYFRTSVEPPAVRVAGRLAPGLRNRAGHRLGRLQAALLGRYVRAHEEPFDLVLSTKNEFAFETPSVLYVHSPQFAAADPGIDRSGPAARAYEGLCTRLAHVDAGAIRSSVVLANSDWTGRAIERAYGVEAETVYPPVDAGKFPERHWREREPGVLTLGRVGPSKRVVENVEVVERLRERGHGLHLHVVGPTTAGAYAARVERAAADREWLSVEGAVSHDRLVELIASHRYGLHGRPYEHFGIVVAELVVGGALPFAPDSGGQREILGGDRRLLYDSVDDAVEKMDRVLSDPDLEGEVRSDLLDARPGLDPARFGERVRQVVNRRLRRS